MRLMIMMIVLFPLSAYATFAPPNAVRLPSFQVSGIGHQKFEDLLNNFETFWGPKVKALGSELYINHAWNDDTVNSDTGVDGNTWQINSYGGLARFPGMTYDGMVAVTCHELGHHMGGAPLYSFEEHWAGGGPATEGSADYWATKECLKAMGWTDARIRGAYKVLAGVLAKLEGSPAPSDKTPDKKVVRKTYEAHPAAQCRFDTYKAGLACAKRGAMSDEDAKVSACYDYPSDAGARPRCWFYPGKVAADVGTLALD
jgi:hypothetical protein